MQYPRVLKNSSDVPFITVIKNSAAHCAHVFNKWGKGVCPEAACLFEEVIIVMAELL